MDETEAVGPNIRFLTPEIRSDELLNHTLPKEIRIKPENKEWDFLSVQLLLNSLEGFRMYDRPRFYPKEPKYFTLVFALYGDDKKNIRFTYKYDSKSIEMKASLAWIEESWTKQVTTKATKTGTHNRKLTQSVEREMTTFIFSISTEDEISQAIIHEHNPIFYTVEDFSKAYCDFINYFSRHWCGDISAEMGFGADFYDLWYETSHSLPICTSDLFFSSNEGYIEFTVDKRNHKNGEAFIVHDDKEYVIKRGIYISPFAESICSKENEALVHGILLDTTWRTLPYFVTSIIMASVCNVGIPLGFSFGPGENKEIYKVFYEKFSSIINVELKKYTIESDRGSALKALAKEIGAEHLSCNAHFLRSLKTTEFSYQIGELVSAKCQTDLDILMKHYSEEFSRYINTDKLESINKALMTCGLLFDKDTKKIFINDKDLWEHVSLNCRAQFKMPTTTNALESSHGHLNAQIPRRNDFYTAMDRLVKFIIHKTHGFEDAYKANLNRARRNIQRKCSPFYAQVIEKESKQYETEKEKCACGETSILSAMMMLDIPCSHRMCKGANFPSKPKSLALKLKNGFGKLIVHLVVEKNEEETTDDNYEKFINRKAAATVRKFCKEKNIDNIKTSLDTIRLDDIEVFANGKPITFFSCVSSGIHQFHTTKPETIVTSADKINEEGVDEN